MKKFFSLFVVALTISLGTAHLEAEAKRIGGGKSVGMQRQAIPPTKTPEIAPNPSPANAAAGASTAISKRNWMGPVAGLATGLGLAALASHLGFSEELMNTLMIALMALTALAGFAFLIRKKIVQNSGSVAYVGAGAGDSKDPKGLQISSSQLSSGALGSGSSMIGSAIGASKSKSVYIPTDFDTVSFVRNAKVQYIRLQASNDAGNLDDIRAFTTPEMFAEIQMDLRERNESIQETRVLDLNADVLEVSEQAQRYVVSVLFTGRVQENGAAPNAICEIWHLTKPTSGETGWILAGIQQIA